MDMDYPFSFNIFLNHNINDKFLGKKELLSYDLIVLGGGITGMFCALSYREKFPKASIAILKGVYSHLVQVPKMLVLHVLDLLQNLLRILNK